MKNGSVMHGSGTWLKEKKPYNKDGGGRNEISLSRMWIYTHRPM
jgi:hypothetical protein